MAVVAGLDVQRDQVLTPDKASVLDSQVKQELSNVNNSLQTSNYPMGVYNIIQDSAKNLQDSLNGLLTKKGIITPNETNGVLDAIDASKKARLQQDYTSGIKNTTLYVGIFAAAVAAYFIIKKIRK